MAKGTVDLAAEVSIPRPELGDTQPIIRGGNGAEYQKRRRGVPTG